MLTDPIQQHRSWVCSESGTFLKRFSRNACRIAVGMIRPLIVFCFSFQSCLFEMLFSDRYRTKTTGNNKGAIRANCYSYASGIDSFLLQTNGNKRQRRTKNRPRIVKESRWNHRCWCLDHLTDTKSTATTSNAQRCLQESPKKGKSREKK